MAYIDCRTLTVTQLRDDLVREGFPAYRAEQLWKWLKDGTSHFTDMTNLPAVLREHLEKTYLLPSVTIEKRLESEIKDDGTVKYLFGLDDGNAVESVLMNYRHGWSQCLSTQVGCKMGCTFCATGMDGFTRNLTPSEMLAQIAAAQTDCGVRVSSVVLMGMGEPLDNFDNVTRFLQLISEPGGINIGMRHLSLSTCGLVDGIVRLMEYKWQLTLSVSLHAPNDEIRTQLMPVARRWNIDELLSVCRDYAAVTGRRISFEYAMIDGVNDSDACARELAARLRGILCHVNLIPLNPVDGGSDLHRRSKAARLQVFRSVLERSGLTATVRRTLGTDINASCGQLRQGQTL